MRILLMLISFILFSFTNGYSQTWTFEEQIPDGDSLVSSVETEIQNNKLLINYCFIYRNLINCMGKSIEEGVFLTLNKDNNNCFSSFSIDSSRYGEAFPLSICFVQDYLLWESSDPAQYIPKRMKLNKHIPPPPKKIN